MSQGQVIKDTSSQDMWSNLPVQSKPLFPFLDRNGFRNTDLLEVRASAYEHLGKRTITPSVQGHTERISKPGQEIGADRMCEMMIKCAHLNFGFRKEALHFACDHRFKTRFLPVCEDLVQKISVAGWRAQQ